MNSPEPTREAGLARLAAFAPRAGRAYANRRNEDRGRGAHEAVSTLSPYLRHRLVLEREVLAAVRRRHSFQAAEKFISEVFWRTYFKGFLERRPTIWGAYRRDLDELREAVNRDGALAADIAAAEAGRTGIDCFDHWARELVETGYLHNHARMWFASIWIFTLRLPWQRGADFFLRQLLDGDPASNTLSWRWVGGLHTKGKTYLARPDNIARYTGGRFRPEGLATRAEPLVETDEHPLRPAPANAPPAAVRNSLLLVTEEDCAAETLLDMPAAAVAGACAVDDRSHQLVARAVTDFTAGALHDALTRAGGTGGPCETLDAQTLSQAAAAAGVTSIVTPYVPVGPAADALSAAREPLAREGIAIHQILRPEDAAAWPHASKGFFAMRKAIPALMP